MKTIHLFAIVLLLAFTASPALSQTAPVVSNVVGVQRAGTKLVDITYDLADDDSSALYVTLQISSDSGVTWIVPTDSATGQIGEGITPGAGRAMVWDAGRNWNNLLSTTMRYRITADDFTGFALIPAGNFSMGAIINAGANPAPVTVFVSAFYMAQHEVTKALWDEVRNWGLLNGYTDLPAGGGKASNHPVQTISWYDMVKWCNALSQKEGFTPCYTTEGVAYKTGAKDSVACNWNSMGYRLPTEAEWEKAARGGLTNLRYPWGDTITHDQANYYSDGASDDLNPTRGFHPSYASGSEPYTSPVGSFAPNGFGLYDVAGNVWEYCWDWGGYLRALNNYGARDPKGAATGQSRIHRGGAWGKPSNYYNTGSSLECSCVMRVENNSAGYAYNYLGFRLARTIVK